MILALIVAAASTQPASAPASAPVASRPAPKCKLAPCLAKEPCRDQPASAPTNPLQPSAEGLAALQELDDAVKHFKDMVDAYRDDQKLAVTDKYRLRRLDIIAAHEEKIQEIEVDERARRLEAIEAFEQFLDKYPADETHTPDAMFRLAELHFERANDEYFTAGRAWEKKQREDPDEAGDPPKQDYSRTIGLYRDLITQFPKYRLSDGAHYLLGYCLGEQGLDDQAIEVFEQLTVKYPKSRFVAEAWTRAGEYYFDTNQLAKAIDAYGHVLEYKGSSFYDKALYKIAWTAYRMDRFDEAVKRFAELVDDAEAKLQKGKKIGTELRGEALQYMAASFAEERWGNLKKAKQFFESIGGRAWAAEVYAMLGEAYFEQSKFPEAIAALELAVKAAPRFASAPKWQDKIVTAYEKQRNFDNAARARDMLAVSYVEGTPWYEANANNPDVVAAARDLSEKSLMAAAVFHHRQAQAYKEAQKMEQALAAYRDAATSYERYLRRFASTKNRYEITYYLADALYYSQQYGRAAAAYAKVRDDPAETQYREIAAYSAVLASERYTQLLEKQGKLAPQPPLKASARLDRPAKRLEIAPERMAVIDAVDGYLNWTKPNDKSPAIAFKAAEVLFAHDHFEEARGRFQCIIDNYPKVDVARFSINLIIESYLAEKNWDEVERFSAGAIKQAKGNDEFVNELKKFKLGAMFKRAEELEAKEKFETAAAEYIRIVDENPQGAFADKALNNAAVNYEKARRFESATKLYERIPKEYPQSPLADYALFRVGVASERFYDFDKAIAAYLKLVDAYPQSKHRPDALYNAALAFENTQRYDKAAELYRRYVDLFPDRKDAAQVFFRAARATDQASGRAAAIAAYEQFIKRYEKDPQSDERIVEAHFRIGELYDRASNETAAKKAYGVAVSESSKRRKGQAFAAQAQFQLGELEFRTYDAILITGPSKAQKTAIVKRAGALTKVRDVYQQVFQFKQVEWTLAALFRIGNLYETFSEKLFVAPAPPEIAKLGTEYVEEYRVLIEQQALPLEDKAIEAYKRTIAEAKKGGVANEWTKSTLKSLNKLRKREFPLQKDARYVFELSGYAAPALVGVKPPEAASQPASEATVAEASP